jgi:hypothetical protein
MKISKFSLITDILIIFSTLFILYFGVRIKDINNSKYFNLVTIGIDWSRSPIESFTETNSECLNQESYFIDDYFRGTSEGCVCTLNIKAPDQNVISKGNCNKNANPICSNVNSIPMIRYKKWNGKAFCTKKHDDNKNSYFDFNFKEKEEQCEKSCGVIDSLGNYMCVKEGDHCPINHIESLPPINSLKSINETQINSYFPKTIFTHFRVSQSKPCADPYYVNNLSNNTYILDNYDESKNCSFSSIGVNEKYILLDSVNFIDLLQENGILNLLNMLPSYPFHEISNTKISLFAGNYIGIRPYCASFLRAKGMIKDTLHTMINMEEIIYTIKSSLINWIFCGMITMFYAIIFTILRVPCRFDSKFKGCSNIFKVILEVILGLIYIILLLKSYYILSNLTKITDIYYYLEIERKDCFDRQTQMLFSEFFEYIFECSWKFKVIVLISFISVLMSFIDTLIVFCFPLSGIETSINVNPNRKINTNANEGNLEMNMKKGDDTINYRKLEIID